MLAHPRQPTCGVVPFPLVSEWGLARHQGSALAEAFYNQQRGAAELRSIRKGWGRPVGACTVNLPPVGPGGAGGVGSGSRIRPTVSHFQMERGLRWPRWSQGQCLSVGTHKTRGNRVNVGCHVDIPDLGSADSAFLEPVLELWSMDVPTGG